jgi:hypothetical protein
MKIGRLLFAFLVGSPSLSSSASGRHDERKKHSTKPLAAFKREA